MSETPTLQARITYILDVYPGISPSMLQTSLGDSKPAEWRPVLDDMIKGGKVIQIGKESITPSNRYYVHTKLYLNGDEVENANSN